MDWSFLIRNKESLSISTDTRNLPAGCVFFALHGEHFDGNKFAKQALEQGATLAVIDNPEYALPEGTLLVKDTLRALQDLARAWRRELGLPIIAITGTNGKTTTKELLAAVLSTKYNIHYTQGNLNNQIGVPLTLLQITRAHKLAIVEMGASHPGDIKELAEIAEPNFGLITNVGRAHLEGFGSFEGVQRTKQELYNYLLKHYGTIFRNADNPYLLRMHQNAIDTHYRYKVKAEQLYKNFVYTTGTLPTGTHLVGEYNAENVSAAICVGACFDVSREEALEAIRQYVPTNNRSQAMKTANNQLIVDAYNANPTSMQAAINVFKGDTYILGAMRELGEYSHLEHQNIVNMLAERKADTVFLVGEEYLQTTSPYPVFETVEQLHEYLVANPLKGKSILLKGSRSTKMENLLDIL
jgi:UDP-N-acetylmuramoyl-tripeptide--D-alanyl-D-alanine ligase